MRSGNYEAQTHFPSKRRGGIRLENVSRFGWLLFFVALPAVEHLAKLRRSAPFGLGPGAALPRWVVADVLGVSAAQVGNPVGVFVLVEANDRLEHGSGRELVCVALQPFLKRLVDTRLPPFACGPEFRDDLSR